MSKVLITVATYQRPDLLRDLLDSLGESGLPEGTRVCVVDNDEEGSARKVAESSSLPLTYVVESTPGIAAARNRGLDEIRPDDAFVVFVDDDERVSPGWLGLLLATQAAYGADVVSGPVISVFSPQTPKWILKGGFIQRARFETGRSMPSAATNNTLVRIDFMREHGSPRFDEAFSLTGGSDTAFFRGLRDDGAQMVWCDDAVVYEDVPADRATFAWVWRRGIRVGNVTGRLHLRHRSRSRLVLEALARIGYGGTRQVVMFLRGRGLEARSIAQITTGVGWIGVARNRLVVEYARISAGDTSSKPKAEM